MRLIADLHVHSRHSRATSREADLDGFHRWARVKGIDVVGTGDFTHPGWLAELSSRLEERDGLFILRDPPREPALEGASPSDAPVRFMLTAEVSSIYKKRGQVRKVHSLIGVPTLDHARRIGLELASIGNVASDGRPILGLDPKDLLSIVLGVTEEGFLIPAHVWTPWFSLFGSRSGFDRIEDCFEELTPRIFALETGLSSDPPMNRRWSALDRYRLVSNSDAHSPGNLGREANLLDAEPTWAGVVGSLRTGAGFQGTCEFFPEEGKYHLDGHRACGVRMDPAETLAAGGICPACGRPVTVGVLNRVLALADREAPANPRPAEGFRYLIPLPELLAECAGVGPGSRAVTAAYARLVSAFGSEYAVLLEADPADIGGSHGALLGEAVRRMRAGEVRPRAGFDGEFGVIRVFDDAELDLLRGQDRLFTGGAAGAGRKPRGAAAGIGGAAASEAAESAARGPSDSALGLDDEQRAIAESPDARILVSAGPGSGKTRVLTRWVRRMAETEAPGGVLALTFTNRAADELRERIGAAGPDPRRRVAASTFHAFCWSVLRELDPGLTTIYTASDRRVALESVFPGTDAAGLDELSRGMERAWEGMAEPDGRLREAMARYGEALARAGGADVSSLVRRCVDLLTDRPEALAEISGRFRTIAVDELQDINPPQYELLMLLNRSADAVLCIGDPDQAIYGFRGSDRRLFFELRGRAAAVECVLRRNYRSTASIVRAADAVMAPGRDPASTPCAAARPAGERVTVTRLSSPGEEARFIAERIRDLVGGVDAVSVDAARTRVAGSRAFSDIAVLYRTRAVRDALLPGLLQAGLPLRLRSSTPLSEEEPMRSLVAAARLVANPSDFVPPRILREREHALGPAGLTERILREGPGLSLMASRHGVAAALDAIAGPILGLARDAPGTAPEAALGLEALRSFAEGFGADLPGFLARASLCVRESEASRTAQCVSLLTFHAAKGLEFPVVFIAGAEDGIAPMRRAARGDEPGRDDPGEERRLFYVAMTRARDQLFITHCARRSRHGAERDQAPSPFLADIPPELVEAGGRRGRGRQLTLF
jgi:DNA helicase II / ATP-dependent DNA helicase PcrA